MCSPPLYATEVFLFKSLNLPWFILIDVFGYLFISLCTFWRPGSLIYQLYSILRIMSTILQLQAQYESLATQYRINQGEMSACIARRDEGISL